MSPQKLTRHEFQKFQQRLIEAHRRRDPAGELAVIEDQILNGSSELKAKALHYRGRFREQQGDLTQAKHDFHLSLELAPNGSFLRHELQSDFARVCEKENDRPAALSWHRQALHENHCSNLNLSAMLRVNHERIDDADRARAIQIIQRDWITFKLPGDPDLSDLPASIHALDRKFQQIMDDAMILPEIGEVIAERQLIYLDEHGREHPALVQIGRPHIASDAEGYFDCLYRISGLDHERAGTATGLDAIDAIRIAMNIIGADLDHIQGIMEGEIRWPAGNDGDLGFPVPNRASD